MNLQHAGRESMRRIDNVHGGAGPILFQSLGERNDFETPWCFMHAALLLPGGGIGHHRHDHCEEIFVTIDNAYPQRTNGLYLRRSGRSATQRRVARDLQPYGPGNAVVQFQCDRSGSRSGRHRFWRQPRRRLYLRPKPCQLRRFGARLRRNRLQCHTPLPAGILGNVERMAVFFAQLL